MFGFPEEIIAAARLASLFYLEATASPAALRDPR
jgi:hypothetical protein